MQVAADLLFLRHHFDERIGEILRMGGHEPDPLDAVHAADHFQKLREGDRLRERLPHVARNEISDEERRGEEDEDFLHVAVLLAGYLKSFGAKVFR